MASPIHKQPPSYLYPQAPPSSHSPQHHSHSHSQASTPFTTTSSVQSPPLSHQIVQQTAPIGYPPFSMYATEQAPNNAHSQSYPYHPTASYDGYGPSGHNALQLQPPPSIDTSITYHPSVPSGGPGGATNYIPARPSPLQHAHSQRMIPGIQQMSGRGQPAGAPHQHAGQTRPTINTLAPIGNDASGVSAGAPAPTSAQGHSAAPVPAAAVGADGQPVRKRPKYTRSKAGCLVCRQKKVKCDEKKPTCTRCLHGHRECSWPKDVPTSTANRSSKAPKSLRGVERDLGDADARSDNFDDDDDVPRSADPSTTTFSPVQPQSAVSSYPGETPTTANSSGGFGAPGASYSYPYTGQGALRPPVAQTIASQAHSRNNSSGSSGVGYTLGAPDAGPEPLAPYFRTGQERNLVGFESISIPYSHSYLSNPNPLPSAPSLPILPTPSSHSSHSSSASWTLAPPISFDSCSSSSASSLSPSSSSPFDVSSLLPSPASSFAAPPPPSSYLSSYSSLGLMVPPVDMSPTSSHSSSSSSSPYAAPQPFVPTGRLEWLQLDDRSFIGFQ